jgi:hypothetical protein
VTKIIQVDNYRFRDDEASLLQSGVWERFVEPVREANTHVRRFLGDVLKNDKVRGEYNITIHDNLTGVQEAIVLKVNDTNERILKVEMRQSLPSARHLVEPHTVQHLWNNSSEWRASFRDKVFKRFSGEPAQKFDLLMVRVEALMAGLAHCMIGEQRAEKNQQEFVLKHRHCNQTYSHEIVVTLYA